MPNWCENEASIEGMGKKGKEALKQIAASIKPRPKVKEDKFGQSFMWDFNELVPLKKRGKPCEWERDLAVKTWGTKWCPVLGKSQFQLRGDELAVSFESAWTPPLAFLKKLCELFPVRVRIEYSEPSDRFAGRAHYAHGKNGVTVRLDKRWDLPEDSEDEEE
jgi:hypothetical protein